MFFGKKKYRFNQDTLTYEQVTHSVKDRVVRVLLYTIFGSTIGLIAIIVALSYVKTPAHTRLEKENEALKKQFAFTEKRLNHYLEVLDYLEMRDSAIYRELFGAAPIDPYLRKGNIDKANYSDFLKLDHNGTVLATQMKLDALKRRLYVQSLSYDTIHDLVRNQKNYFTHMPAIQPLSNKQLTRIASGFGLRIHPIFGILKFHSGLDFAAPIGTPVYATGDGEVARVNSQESGYGRHIVIKHGYGYETLYAHLSKFDVKVKQKVKRGDVIGYVGNSGTSTSPHLHYEVIRNGKQENPIRFFFNELSPEEYEEVLKLSQNAARSFD